MSVVEIEGQKFAIVTVPLELSDRFRKAKVLLQVVENKDGYLLIPNDEENEAYKEAESLLFEQLKSTLFKDETVDQPEGFEASVGAPQAKNIAEATVLEKDNWDEMTDDERSAAIGAFELDVVVHPSIVRDFDIGRLHKAEVPITVSADKSWSTKVRVDIKKSATPMVILKPTDSFYSSSFKRQVFQHSLPEINAKISVIWPIIEANQRARDARRQAPVSRLVDANQAVSTTQVKV